jgi:hypothetical protein
MRAVRRVHPKNPLTCSGWRWFRIRFARAEAEGVGVEPTKPDERFAVLQTAGLGHLPIPSALDIGTKVPVDGWKLFWKTNPKLFLSGA